MILKYRNYERVYCASCKRTLEQDYFRGCEGMLNNICEECETTCRCGHSKARHNFEITQDGWPISLDACSDYSCVSGGGCATYEALTPYAMPGKMPTTAEIATVALVVIAMFIFGIGLNIAEGANK